MGRSRNKTRGQAQPVLTDEERGRMLFEACAEPFEFSGKWGVGNVEVERKWIRAANAFTAAMHARIGELFQGGQRRG